VRRYVVPDDTMVIHNQGHTGIPEACNNGRILRSSRAGPGDRAHDETRDARDSTARGRMDLTGRVRPLRFVRRGRRVDVINVELAEVLGMIPSMVENGIRKRPLKQKVMG
jgi:hypothetical protein